MRRVGLLCALLAACGDTATSADTSPTTPGDATTATDAADTAVASETTSAPTDAIDDTAVEDTATDDTTVEDTAVEDTATDDTTVEDTAVEDTAVEDTVAPAVCRDATADAVEGLYRDGALVAACLTSERCSADDSACVPARCFPAEGDFAEGVYAKDGEARGELLEACAEGFRCDDATPHCERIPNGGLPVGFVCDSDLDCAGPEGFEGRCISSPGGFELSAGRCGHGCAGPSDCPSGAHCAFLDSADPVCVADCPAFVACPPLATCQDPDEDGVDECMPPGAEKTHVGAACASAEDCRGDVAHAYCVLDGDVFWQGGYCMTYTCKSDGDCQSGTHCGFFGSGVDGGLCVADCDAEGACAREGHGCWDIDLDGRRECMPSAHGPGAINAPCDHIDDCGGGDGGQCSFLSAVTDGSGRCTKACHADADCPDGAICGGRSGGGYGACTLPCADVGDCASGQACADRDFDGRPECGFAGEGPLAQNAACTTTDQCGTGPRGFCLGAPNFTGLCTAVCLGDADCGAASHCMRADGGGRGFCAPECRDSSACASGSACVDFDHDARTECGPAGSGTVAIGEGCTTGADCGGGAGSFCGAPELVCTRFCAVDADCGAGARCLDFAGTHTCRKRCTTNAQCGASMRCVDADADGGKECMKVGIGTNPVGAACQTNNPCARGLDLVCVPAEPGGFCTRACGPTLACPDGSHCGALPSETVAACVPDCVTNDDCRDDGYACFDGDGDGAKECLPFGGGEGAVGEACATTSDCAGGERARCVQSPAAFAGACALTCGDASACGADDNCVALPEVSSTVCVPSCADDSTCREQYTCEDLDGVGRDECVHACASDADCRLFIATTKCGSAGVCTRP